MKEESITDALLREFLLGGLDDNARQRIETLFLTDPQTKENVLITEQDLIEDYLDDSLSKEDKERFVSRYAQTAEQRRKLRITKSIRDWAVTEPAAHRVTPAPVSAWSRFWTQPALKPALVVASVVIIVIATVIAIVWLNSQRQRRNHMAIEQELAQLNSAAALREIPSQMISQELKPVAVRGLEHQTEISLRPDFHIVEFTLPWIQADRYATYEASIRRLDDDEVFTIPNLQAESNDSPSIRIRIPTHILTPGNYQIHLKGIAVNGAQSSAEYSFTIR